MIKSLQSLRLIFAIMIFLHHFGYEGRQFAAGGPMGVCFFIMLSGFVMSAGYGEKTLSDDFIFKNYFLKRLIHLWPLHILCLSFLIVWYHHVWLSSFRRIAVLGINAMMLQSWIPIQKVYFSGNAVSWCLSVFIFCYLIFPFIYRFIVHSKIKSLAILTTTILIAYFILIWFIPDKYVHPLIYISPLFRIIDFILGILAYRFLLMLSQNDSVKNFFLSKSTFILTIYELLIIILASASVLLYYHTPERLNLTSIWWPISLIIIITSSLSEIYMGGVPLKTPKIQNDGKSFVRQFHILYDTCYSDMQNH